MTSPERYFLLNEMAEQTGLSFRALSDAARNGTLKTYKAHGRRYVTQSQFDEYMSGFLAGGLSAPVPVPDATERFLQRMDRKRVRKSVAESRSSEA